MEIRVRRAEPPCDGATQSDARQLGLAAVRPFEAGCQRGRDRMGSGPGFPATAAPARYVAKAAGACDVGPIRLYEVPHLDVSPRRRAGKRAIVRIFLSNGRFARVNFRQTIDRPGSLRCSKLGEEEVGNWPTFPEPTSLAAGRIAADVASAGDGPQPRQSQEARISGGAQWMEWLKSHRIRLRLTGATRRIINAIIDP